MATAITAIRPASIKPHNPLDHAVHSAGKKLQALQMTRLVGEPDKGDAQQLTRDLLDISKIVDDMLLSIGWEARGHFGADVNLEHFTDQLRDAIEGNATHVICKAAEGRDEDRYEEAERPWRSGTFMQAAE